MRSREVAYGRCDVEVSPAEPDSFLSKVGKHLAHRFWLMKTDPNDFEKNEATVIKTVLINSEQDFLAKIAYAYTYGKQKQREILLFVHGYDNTFNDAQESAAKIAYNSDFGGVTATFSWPSENNALLYPRDRNNAYWSVAYLERFLKLLVKHKETQGIHIVAHSMGNEVLLRAVQMALSANNEAERRLFVSKVRSISFAAPDVDEDTFRDQFGAQLNKSGINITVYTSEHDRALMFSEKLQGYTRLGRSVAWAANFTKLAVVDASQAGTDWMGHAAIRTSKTLAQDLSCTITGCDRNSQPFIHRVSTNFWKLTPP
jgi:esterase/lipase superfamily enzyme